MIKVTHNCGFFSNCSVKLHYIIEYFNKEKKLPDSVDSSEQFIIYKPIEMMKKDITYDFFEIPKLQDIYFEKNIEYDWNATVRPYKNLDFKQLKPFIDIYFSPCDEIKNIYNFFVHKYNLNFDNLCAVYYRGTDQYKEVPFHTMNQFVEKMKSIKDVIFLVQSDDLHFINIIKANFTSNIIIFEENHFSSTNKGIHNEFSGDTNYSMIKYFFATVLVMAKCKYFICSVSNCSMWCVLYKNNSKNVYQYLNDSWITEDYCNNCLLESG